MSEVSPPSLKQQLHDRLESLSPSMLVITNESQNHGGYFEGKESHFKVDIVSEVFVGLRSVQRHQKVYAAVDDLLAPSKIHALAIHAFSADEWKGQSVDSPQCANNK
jgi:BolA protein